MKKTYLSPDAWLTQAETESFIAASVDGFHGTIDDENTINSADDMLSRRKQNIWDAEEE